LNRLNRKSWRGLCRGRVVEWGRGWEAFWEGGGEREGKIEKREKCAVAQSTHLRLQRKVGNCTGQNKGRVRRKREKDIWR